MCDNCDNPLFWCNFAPDKYHSLCYSHFFLPMTSNKYISDSIQYIGVDDPELPLFESQYMLENGMAYNSYLIRDEKIAVMDAVDARKIDEWMARLSDALAGRTPDYLVVLHVEPDHSAGVKRFLDTYPEAKVVGNAKTFTFLSQFFPDFDFGERKVVVKEADTLCLGNHTLRFIIVPMVHWPETMVTYESTERILFSGDVFGCYGALNGAVIDKDMDTALYFKEMERYYATILGKYAAPVEQALKKLSGLPIDIICSTHGPVWTEEADKAVGVYRRMAAGEAEHGLVVCYGSMYGYTRRVAEAVAEGAAAAGMKKIIMHDVSLSPLSDILADIYRYDTLALGAPTYNGDVFPKMEDLLRRLAARVVKNRRMGCFGGFTWAAQSVKKIMSANEQIGMTLVGDPVEWKQGVGEDTLEKARALGKQLAG